MIVRMTKYGFVLLTGRREEFLSRLQLAGIVDVTQSEVELTAEQRELTGHIERLSGAVEYARTNAKNAEEYRANADSATDESPFETGAEAFEAYRGAQAEAARLAGEAAQWHKELTDVEIWGDFSRGNIAKLRAAGVEVRLCSMYAVDYRRLATDDLMIESVGESDGRIYFVALGEMPAEAQEHRLPEHTATEIEAQIAETERLTQAQQAILRRVVVSGEKLREERARLLDQLALSQARSVAREGAEGSLTVIEGFVPTENEAEIEALVAEFEDVCTLSGAPEAEEDVPVALKNSRFIDAFRFVGDFYALPKYGTTDLLPFFAPFYMLFFGFCMGDAGYGAILVAGYFVLRGRKSMARVARLTLYCGIASVVFGLLTGSVFGMELASWMPLAGIREYFLTTDMLFYLALGLGLVQIVFGSLLNIIGISRQQSFWWSLGRVGWLVVLVSSLVAFFTGAMSEWWYLVALCVGLVGIFLLNHPRRNPLINIGAGIWNTYNDITGLLGDVLSYIRLFALCLSGGTLAVVFNSLVVGITGSIPLVIGIPVAILLLAFLHGINIFMAVIGSFVHPMRLTFVEFYKNAGFEAATRAYTPLRRN